MTYSVRNIAIALALAVAAAVAVVLYTSSFKDQVTRDQERVAVMVAKQDIEPGTPGEQAAGMMEVRDVLRTDFTAGSLTTTGGLEGKVTSQKVYADQQVHSAVFQTPTTQAASLSLDKTERGVRVTVDFASGVLGAIQAGDHIDYFASFKTKAPGMQGDGLWFTRRLMTDVRVLEAPAPDAESGPGKLSEEDSKTDNQTLMLAVTQADAAKLVFAEAAKKDAGAVVTWAAVRPPDGQAEEMAVTIETLDSMLQEGVPVSELRKKYNAYIDGIKQAEIDAQSASSGAAAGPTVADAMNQDVTGGNGQ
jgi:Flp pilus assembly protein CpaB